MGVIKHIVSKTTAIDDVQSEQLEKLVGSNTADTLRENLELVEGVYPSFNRDEYLAGTQQPVFFGSGIKQLRS
jgi:peptide chain release factor 3